MQRKVKAFQTFPSKVLLFGEHIINKGAQGLAIPSRLYSGKLTYSKTDSEEDKNSNHSLAHLAKYIIEHPELEKHIAINDFLTAIERGLVFDSNIPQGYGMGSSGALVAAVLSAYGHAAILDSDIQSIKNFLAAMESCFHGRSSGLDPIVAYLQKPLLVSMKDTQVALFKKSPAPVFDVSLFDTGMPRKTADWVRLFMERTQQHAFGEIVKKSMLPANQICIDAMLNLKYVPFWKSLKLISQLQFDYMQDFIPKAFHGVWKNGLLNNEYYLKICGAGGGGFILCFSKANTDLSNFRFAERHEVMKF